MIGLTPLFHSRREITFPDFEWYFTHRQNIPWLSCTQCFQAFSNQMLSLRVTHINLLDQFTHISRAHQGQMDIKIADILGILGFSRFRNWTVYHPQLRGKNWYRCLIHTKSARRPQNDQKKKQQLGMNAMRDSRFPVKIFGVRYHRIYLQSIFRYWRRENLLIVLYLRS